MSNQAYQIEGFSQEETEPKSQSQLARQYNLKLIKSYLRKSYLTIISFSVMLIMFAISIIMTYQSNSQSPFTFGIMGLNPAVLVKLGANVGFSIKNGELYRLFTPIFLHVNIQHFLLNSISIFGLVMLVQEKVKKSIFLLTFFIGGAQGNLLTSFVNFLNQNELTVSVGASTSICAVLGLYLATIYIISLKNGNVGQIQKQIGLMVIYLLIVSILPGVDFYGHLGSFIGGTLIGLSFSALRNDISEDSLLVKKIKLVALILYANYTILELILFVI